MASSTSKSHDGMRCRICARPIAEKHHGHLKCRACFRSHIEHKHYDRRRERRREAIASGADLRCPRCGETKPATEFYSSGASSYCKPCQREYSRTRLRARRTHGGPWVYLIQCEALDAVKIGYSADAPEQRLRVTQIGNPYELKLFGIIEGDRQIEKFLHRTLAEFHMRGEWFNNARSILRSLERTTPLVRAR